MDISVSSSGSTSKTQNFLKNLLRGNLYEKLSHYGEKGVVALANATPVESGETAAAWGYEIVKSKHSYTIVWTNHHLAGSTPVAILLQYGHGTRNGGYVQGRDFINPAMRPIFDEIAAEAWKAVTSREYRG